MKSKIDTTSPVHSTSSLTVLHPHDAKQMEKMAPCDTQESKGSERNNKEQLLVLIQKFQELVKEEATKHASLPICADKSQVASDSHRAGDTFTPATGSEGDILAWNHEGEFEKHVCDSGWDYSRYECEENAPVVKDASNEYGKAHWHPEVDGSIEQSSQFSSEPILVLHESKKFYVHADVFYAMFPGVWDKPGAEGFRVSALSLDAWTACLDFMYRGGKSKLDVPRADWVDAIEFAEKYGNYKIMAQLFRLMKIDLCVKENYTQVARIYNHEEADFEFRQFVRSQMTEGFQKVDNAWARSVLFNSVIKAMRRSAAAMEDVAEAFFELWDLEVLKRDSIRDTCRSATKSRDAWDDMASVDNSGWQIGGTAWPGEKHPNGNLDAHANIEVTGAKASPALSDWSRPALYQSIPIPESGTDDTRHGGMWLSGERAPLSSWI